MSEGASQAHHGQIIIVRRHSDHEEGHHGGAWKIAFADFMTAMMCFFLVMWLINAANEQTKASVASYFNPVKLVDRNTAKKGLEESGEGAESEGSEASESEKAKGGKASENDGGPAENAVASEISDTPTRSDSSLFADPYAVLAEIAAETGKNQNVSEKGEGGAQDAGPATGASGGEAYRDPFAPDFWTSQVAVPSVAEASAERSAPAQLEAEPGDSLPAEEKGPSKVEPTLPGETPAAAPVPDARPAPEPLAEKPPAEEAPQPAPAKPEGPSAAAQKAAAEIRAELEKSFGPGDKGAKDISVEATERGVVISVTEGLDFSMFEIGSALPESALVQAMDKIGAAIRDRRGTITIEGHTDARPFHNDRYDNWRLSTARAHAAYYMLLRAGLAERRVVEVAGFADRKPKNKADTLAAENRRIEILVEVAP